jgi:hypothetical protein
MIRNKQEHLRTDHIYLVVTIGKRVNSYYLRVKEPTLAPNQYAYRIMIQTDEREWMNRISQLNLIKVTPPARPVVMDTDVLMGKDITTKTLDRMAGR